MVQCIIMKSVLLSTICLFIGTTTSLGFILSSLSSSSRLQQRHQLHSPCSTRVALSRESDKTRDLYLDGDDSVEVSRRTVLSRSVWSLLALPQGVTTVQYAHAFDGSGSSVSSGYNPATKAEQKRRYKDRVAADVRDFLVLGKAIDAGETEGNAWVNFFITFQRREPDEVGRTYAALADLRGLPTKKANEFEGGGGLLLANTFTKAGKPPDNTPAVKSFLKLSKSFDAIEVAGKKGDAAKAKQAWEGTSVLFSQYLSDVEMPASLDDPLYKS